MKKVLLLLVCMLVLICFCFFGCTPEDTESGNESGIENDVSAVVSDTQDVFIEIDYQTVIFSSFEEIAEISLLSNEQDYNAYFEKDGHAPLSKSKMADLICVLHKMPIAVLNSEKYELAVISCHVYLDGSYSIELVYNGALDRLRIGAYTYDGTVEPDETITDVITDTLTLGDHSMQMHTMAKENNYCTLKGRIVSDDYVVYAHYKGDTVLPESLKDGVTLTTLEEIIKPYVK
jgi:hypothetical protein